MPRYRISARKRRVTLILNEDLVAQMRTLTDDLSGVVETLLADYVERAGLDRDARRRRLSATIAAWNARAAKHGSLADEYSPRWTS